MTSDQLNKIVGQFFKTSNKLDFQYIESGHIHDTYKITVDSTLETYLLQRINTNVFNFPDVLVNNHNILSGFLSKSSDNTFRIPDLYPLADSAKYLYFDEKSQPWRMMEYIDESFSIDRTSSPAQAFEAGKAYGWFLKETKNLDPADFAEAIPDFHSLVFRLKQLSDAIDQDSAGRKSSCMDTIDFFMERRSFFLELIKLIQQGKIPVRVTHNDTKVNNVLFNKKGAVAVIDLDTVGPGTILYDYGDALRTIANTSEEDEKNPARTSLDTVFFSEFTRGYLEFTREIMSADEVKNLYKAPGLMTYIIGIRFLADYLNGDKYYKTKYPSHNLVRTKVQIRLLESLEQNSSFMKNYIDSIINI